MSAQVNCQGLARYIPAEVKREVRRRCGFGCVMCGNAIIEYHHFAPPFADATAHDPAGITLLCGACHARVDRGLIAETAVRAANANPWCLRRGYTRESFFAATRPSRMVVGGVICDSLKAVMFDDEVVLGFTAPAQTGEPLLLTASLSDANGDDLLTIIDNEWRVGADRFDVEVEGNKLIVRQRIGELLLVVRFLAPDELLIERLAMKHRGFEMFCWDRILRIVRPNGTRMEFNCVQIIGRVAIRLWSTGQASLAYGSDQRVCLPAPSTGGQQRPPTAR